MSYIKTISIALFLIMIKILLKIEKKKTQISDINEKVKYLLYFWACRGSSFWSIFIKVYVSYFNLRCLSYMSKHKQCLSQRHIYWNYGNCSLNFWVFFPLLSICRYFFFKICFIYILFWHFPLKLCKFIFKKISYYHILRR